MHDHVPPSIPSTSRSISGGQPSIAIPAGPLRFRILLGCLAGVLAGVFALGLVAQAGAADRVTLGNGDELTGSVFSLAPDGIEIETEDGVQKLSVMDYRTITFDGEPAELDAARRLLEAGKPQAAGDTLAALSAEELAELDRRIREEHRYLSLVAAARAASPQTGEAATAALAAFLASNPRSHHTYPAREVLGDILAAQGRFEDATAAYRELDRGPPALRVRAAAAQGRLLAAAGKPADAIRKFEAAAAISTEPGDTASIAQKQEAALGLARCLAAVGKPDEATAAVRHLIAGADPADEALLATAFTALGACQRAGGHTDDALISFLTVDLVYNRQPAARAESLRNLVQLWEATNNPERARAARAALIDSFPDSPWTKSLAKPEG